MAMDSKIRYVKYLKNVKNTTTCVKAHHWCSSPLLVNFISSGAALALVVFVFHIFQINCPLEKDNPPIS